MLMTTTSDRQYFAGKDPMHKFEPEGGLRQKIPDTLIIADAWKPTWKIKTSFSIWVF